MGKRRKTPQNALTKEQRNRPEDVATPSERRMPAWVKTTLAAVGAVALAVVTGLAGSFLGVASERNTWPYSAPSEQELAADLDGVYPSSECKANYGAVASGPILAQNGTALARMELRRGSECHASWVWVDSAVAGVTVTKVLSRAAQGELEELSVIEDDAITDAAGPGSESFTKQVYSPQCVTFEVTIRETNGGALLGSVPATEWCATG